MLLHLFRSRLSRRLGSEDGVVLILVALVMTVLLGCAALAIDLGSFYAAQKKAQAAADAAALAAVQDLPSNTTQATTDVQTYIAKNDPGASYTITTPYNGNPGAIKVTVSKAAPAFFARIWGVTSENVGARATAGASPGVSKAAVFGYDSVCSHAGVDLEGNSPSIDGGVYSNGSITDNAMGSGSLGPATYGGPNHCSAGGRGHTTFSSTTPSSTLMPYPIDYRTLPNPCGGGSSYDGLTVFYGTNFAWTSTGETIPSGIYCATGEIDLTAPEGLSGSDVVFIAPKINFTANHSNLSAPSAYPLLFWVTGANQEFDLNGEHETLSGNLFDPTGPVVINPNNSTDSWNGFIEANDVVVNGESFTITGSGPTIGTSGYALSG